MIIVRDIKAPLSADFSNYADLLETLTKTTLGPHDHVELYRRSIDARDKGNVHFICSFTIDTENEKHFLKVFRKYKAEVFEEPVYDIPHIHVASHARPVIIGFGPAGMFAGLYLAKAGLRPIIYERGKDADSRQADIESYFNGSMLQPESNIQFGEGGAGTFSDGKLFTGVKDKRIREVLRTFVKHGADERILWEQRPHIGTDVLIKIVKSIRREIESLGGEVHFESKLISFEETNGLLSSITIEKHGVEQIIPCKRLILAIGHSARDTFFMLRDRALTMEPKAFAVGTRIEHLQSKIDASQYGRSAGHPALGAAEYHLAAHLLDGRGVFSFCMCPGGVVINAASEEGYAVTNGMSYSKRDGVNANAGLLVSVTVDDFYRGDVLDGVRFQREIEKKAFELGKGRPLSQTVGDFLANRPSSACSAVKPTLKPSPEYGDLHEVFPSFISNSLAEGIRLLDRKLHGFADPDALLTGPETRSSSPVRIVRDDVGCSSVWGIFPCGEGAGYAGGITSAAVDGLKTAERLAATYTD